MSNFIDTNQLCPGCMTRIENKEIPCPKCGWQADTAERSPHQLPLQTILNGKYLVGRVLGEGGFGITYLGWDLNLDLKVAIKEYYPSGFVTRENTVTTTVTPFSGDKREAFFNGLDKFVGEAKSLAKFYSLPGVVSVKDFFKENGTGYIVMEYVEGITLKQYLKKEGGKLPVFQVLEWVKPLIKSLTQMHEKGIIHRDISPDNIMITTDGEIKLLDFGAARDISTDGAKSLSVLLKPGYAPEEQYRTRGQQGPWTDVYALCATIYKAITGQTPPESMERMREDTLVPPSQLGIDITETQEAALLMGLAVLREKRISTMGLLDEALFQAVSPDIFQEVTVGENTSDSKTLPLSGLNSYDMSASADKSGTSEFTSKTSKVGKPANFAVIAVIAVIVLVVSLWTVNSLSGRNSDTSAEGNRQSSQPGRTHVQDVTETPSEPSPTQAAGTLPGTQADATPSPISEATPTATPVANAAPEATPVATAVPEATPIAPVVTTPVPTLAPTPTPKEEKQYYGTAEFEINGKKHVFYASGPASFGAYTWKLDFFPEDVGVDFQMLWMDLPKEVTSGSTYSEELYLGVLHPLNYAKGDKTYVFPYNPQGFSELYQSTCTVTVDEWGGSGGLCKGRFTADLTLTNGDKIEFRNGEFQIEIQGNGF